MRLIFPFQIIVNELSLGAQYPSFSASLEGLRYFSDLCYRMRNHGFGKLLISRELFQAMVYDRIPLSQCLNLISERDLRLKLKDLLINSDTIADDIRTTADFECRFHGRTAIGLGIAHSMDTRMPTISFTGHPDFSITDIPVSWLSLENIEHEYDAIVKTYQNETQITASVEQEWQALFRSVFSSGALLLKKATAAFPFLSFSEPAIEALSMMTGNDALFPNVCITLESLNRAMSFVRNNGGDYMLHLKTKLLPVTEDESASVHNDQRLRNARRFKWPDGQQRYCFPHKTLGSKHRLHFCPDQTTHTVYVGYIGVHLPL